MANQNRHVIYSLAGLCCMLVGVGLGRFAYTPILPLMISEHWLTSLQAGYLGAINFLGYLLGAILGRICIQWLGSLRTIQYALIACTMSFFLCMLSFGSFWLDFWRAVAGFGGALLMITAPTLIFPHVPPHLKGRVGGIIFSGVGIGIVISGIVVPFTGLIGLRLTWFVVGFIALLALLFAWFNLPKVETHEQSKVQSLLASLPEFKWPVILLTIAYFFGAIGFTPHSLFLVACIQFYFHYSSIFGGLCWALFGIGAVIGTISFGFLADHLGVAKCFAGAYVLATALIACILSTDNMIIIAITSFLMGMLFLSTVSLAAAELSQLVTHHAYAALWGVLIVSFAVGQTGTAYLISHLMQQSNGFILIFLLALGTLFIAAVAAISIVKCDGNAAKKF